MSGPLGRYTRPLLIGVGLIAALAVYQNRDDVLNLFREHSSPGGPTTQTHHVPDATPVELALVAPLERGGKLLDYEVEAIHGVREGIMRIALAKDEATVDLTLALVSQAGPLAPFAAGPYAIYYSSNKAPGDAPVRLGAALAEIVKANAGASTPPGLSTYRPVPRSDGSR